VTLPGSWSPLFKTLGVSDEPDQVKAVELYADVKRYMRPFNNELQNGMENKMHPTSATG
jgi:hypothetical protein